MCHSEFSVCGEQTQVHLGQMLITVAVQFSGLVQKPVIENGLWSYLAVSILLHFFQLHLKHLI